MASLKFNHLSALLLALTVTSEALATDVKAYTLPDTLDEDDREFFERRFAKRIPILVADFGTLPNDVQRGLCYAARVSVLGPASGHTPEEVTAAQILIDGALSRGKAALVDANGNPTHPILSLKADTKSVSDYVPSILERIGDGFVSNGFHKQLGLAVYSTLAGIKSGAIAASDATDTLWTQSLDEIDKVGPTDHERALFGKQALERAYQLDYLRPPKAMTLGMQIGGSTPSDDVYAARMTRPNSKGVVKSVVIANFVARTSDRFPNRSIKKLPEPVPGAPAPAPNPASEGTDDEDSATPGEVVVSDTEQTPVPSAEQTPVPSAEPVPTPAAPVADRRSTGRRPTRDAS